jgi:membrane-associated phospholipid phosphatase
VGKPRPDVIARCIPDLDNIAKFAVSGFPTTPLGSPLVSAGICQQTSKSILDDGWRSWPSGHSSFSAAGLVYLSLFLASKLALTLPFLSPKPATQSNLSYYSAFPSRNHPSPHEEYPSKYTPRTPATNLDNHQIAARNQAASPPLYLLALAFIPTGAAMYIAASRFSDFRHHGFDILSGSFLGTVTAFAAFRYYHLPLSRGAGWSWGPRSTSRAFWAGVGTGSYVGEDGARGDGHVEAAMMADMGEGSGESTHPHGLDGGRDTVGVPAETTAVA